MGCTCYVPENYWVDGTCWRMPHWMPSYVKHHYSIAHPSQIHRRCHSRPKGPQAYPPGCKGTYWTGVHIWSQLLQWFIVCTLILGQGWYLNKPKPTVSAQLFTDTCYFKNPQFDNEQTHASLSLSIGCHVNTGHQCHCMGSWAEVNREQLQRSPDALRTQCESLKGFLSSVWLSDRYRLALEVQGWLLPKCTVWKACNVTIHVSLTITTFLWNGRLFSKGQEVCIWHSVHTDISSSVYSIPIPIPHSFNFQRQLRGSFSGHLEAIRKKMWYPTIIIFHLSGSIRDRFQDQIFHAVFQLLRGMNCCCARQW